MSILLTKNNIRNIINRQVFDPTVAGFVGVGRVVGTFTVSGELGVEVRYELDRLRLNTAGQMSGIITHEVSGTLSTGVSYIDWAQLSDSYVSDHPSEREAALRGMYYSTLNKSVQNNGSGIVDIGVFGTRQFVLIREIYYSGNILYYPDAVAAVSGLPSISSIRVI